MDSEADSVGGSFVSTPAEQAMGDEKGLSMFLYYPSVPMPGLSIHNPSSSTVAAKLAAGCSGVDEEIYGRDFRNLLTRCDASLESQNTQCNIPPILSSPAVNFCSWESLNPRPVAVSKKTAKVSGLSSVTAPKRSPDGNFTCKVCQRVLSGDNFYQRHLQCISCQMAINSVARTMKVAHSDAKYAYMDAIQAAPKEQRADLEYHRNHLHKDAEDRIFHSLAGSTMEQIVAADPSVQTKAEDIRTPRKTTRAGKFIAADTAYSPGKRRRCTTWAGAKPKVQAWSHDATLESPFQGMMLLLKACEHDLDLLDSTAEPDSMAGWS